MLVGSSQKLVVRYMHLYMPAKYFLFDFSFPYAKLRWCMQI